VQCRGDEPTAEFEGDPTRLLGVEVAVQHVETAELAGRVDVLFELTNRVKL
jgi:hypothetical protein